MKLYPSVMLMTALIAQSLQAWSSHGNPEFEHPKPVQFVDNRVGFFELDYLFWKPYQEDMNFAIHSEESFDDNGSIDLKFRPKSPEYGLSSGVRLGLGVYTSDVWDISVRGTYLYSDATKDANADGSATDALFPSVFPFLQGQAGSEASGYIRLNFGIGDVILGRSTALSPRFTVHPFIGIRTVFIRQLFKSRFEAGVEGSEIPGSFKNVNNVWGIGPRAGLDSSFYFADNWSVQGGLSGAFVLGNFRVRQKLNGFTNGTQMDVSLKDSSALIRANLDGYLGIGWDKYFNDNKNRVYVALLCETSYWFGINQFMDLDVLNANVPPTGSVVAKKRHGDLAFFGGTVHFQLDF